VRFEDVGVPPGSLRTSDTNSKTSAAGRAIDVLLSAAIVPLPSIAGGFYLPRWASQPTRIPSADSWSTARRTGRSGPSGCCGRWSGS